MIINEKRTYICIKLDLQQKDLCKKMHNISPTYDILKICWQKGEVYYAERNESEIQAVPTGADYARKNR